MVVKGFKTAQVLEGFNLLKGADMQAANSFMSLVLAEVPAAVRA